MEIKESYLGNITIQLIKLNSLVESKNNMIKGLFFITLILLILTTILYFN